MRKKLRIYLDTSVIGGCFDDEFSAASLLLFRNFENNLYIPLISEITTGELENAPQKVKDKIIGLKNLGIISVNNEMEILAKKYISNGIVTMKYAGDALHIAVATIIKADVLVSWNFKHIVNLKKIYQFNTVNLKESYGLLEIRTPQEVVENE
ncbi:MAG: hypothetical protein FD145_1242 [Candidatus Saganbacteria bacterium]|uniref:PIN domain-containing protein n=1 Tax=Candidatus Saganbacteria bacterium TaxID=2575572 RepID=A0A833L2Y4_UNCSA|nr:MAG: hypothetical protein FD145_1242 [Candidatus Saganbacteria bacterium]